MTDEEKMKLASMLANASPEGVRAISQLYAIDISKVRTENGTEPTVAQFLATDIKLHGVEVEEGYKQYILFCQEKELHPVTKRSFVHQVNRALNYVTEMRVKNGNVHHRYFIDPKSPIPFEVRDETTESIQKFIDSEYFLKYAKVSDYKNQVTSFVYSVYTDFCIEKNLYCTNNIVFSRKFCELTGHSIKNKKISGVIRRVFTN